MKHIFIFLLGSILSASAVAQTLSITFNGTNRNRNYQVVLDGTSYYSNSRIDPNNDNASVRKDIILSNQQTGTHTIAVYRLRNNNGNYTNGTNTSTYGRAIYSKTFQLREGYDMDIIITGNGQVSFTERRARNEGRRDRDRHNVAAMSDAVFNPLYQNIRSRWSQSSKVTAERNTFLNTANYFSTAQVRQLLLLIATEANRVALAKLAYSRVVDPANFTTLYDLIGSTAGRDDINAYIRNNPNNNGGDRYDRDHNNGNWNNNNGNNQYRSAMADYQFTQLLQTVNSQWNQTGKYNAISGAFNNSANYFSTVQIRQLLSLINTEPERLALAKLSYSRVSDPTNFSTLYNLFYNQAYRNDLNNYVIQNGGTTGYNNNTQYSNRAAMNDATFSLVLQKASNHFLPWDKVRDVRDDFNNTAYYFTTAQIRQLLLLVPTENDRLELAKLSWSRVTDPSYFTQLYDLFTNQASRDDLNSYITAHPF